MKKSFLTLMFLAAVSFQAFAQREVVFDFTKNPWNAPTTTKAEADKDAEVAKLDDDSKILTTDGVTLTQKKNNAKKWTRIVDNQYVAYANSTFTILVEGEQKVTHIDVYFTDADFEGIEGAHYDPKEPSSHYTWDGEQNRISAKAWGDCYISKIVVQVKGENPNQEDEKPTPEENENENMAIFDFSKNPWGVPTITGDEAYEEGHGFGKLEDDVVMTTGPVTLSQKKHNAEYWNRIIDDTYRVYKKNDFTFTAKEGKVITRIEFVNKPYLCDILYKGNKVECENEDEDTPYIWTGKEQSATFTALMTSFFKAFKVTVEDKKEPTGIKAVNPVKENVNSKVYNIQGQYVGTRSDFNTLPKGIYIVNGKKIVK